MFHNSHHRSPFTVLLSLVAFIFAAAPCAAQQPVLNDDFAAAQSIEQRWELPFGYEAKNGALHAQSAQRMMAVWKAAPFAHALFFEAQVTLSQALGDDWKTAGIGLHLDGENFWHLALVEAPAAQEKRHFGELAEMFDGRWNAQSEAATRLTTLDEAPAFAWKYDTPYRLRLTLTGGATATIRGEIFAADAEENAAPLWNAARRLDNKAVMLGQPMLSVSGFEVAFDNAQARIVQTAPTPQRETQTPPFQSSLLSPDAPLQTARASGFFRVEEQNGVWWLIDPLGQRTLSIGTDHVNYNGHHSQTLGYAPYHRVVEKKFGTAQAWGADAARRLRAWNFNVLGTNASPEARHRGLADAQSLQFGTDFAPLAALVEKTTWTGFPDVFDPRWEKFCDWRARVRCTSRRDDPWLLGYYLDNELEWHGKTFGPFGLVADVAKLPATAAGKRALQNSLREFYHDDIAAFNRDFATQLADFTAILNWKSLPAPQNEKARAALHNFTDLVAQRYFETAARAIRKYDPNHLILGNRFASDAPDAAWRRAGQSCDVVSVNVYPRVNLAQERVIGLREHLEKSYALCRRPLIITEWSFPALDAVDSQGVPLPSRHGAGMRVDNQAQKARAYAIMQRALFELPFVAGSHYFMWADEPAGGISPTFPEDSNYGLVSESDEPYPALTRTAAQVNALMPRLHAGQIKSDAIPIPDAPLGDFDLGARRAGVVKYEKTAAGFILENGVLKLVKNSDSAAAFDAIFWRENAASPWRELGRYEARLHLKQDDTDQWLNPEHVAFTVRENSAQRLVLDAIFERATAPSFRAAYRFTMEAGLAAFAARGLWVENSGSKSWQLRGYYHYALPRLNGDASDDAPSGPNYYLPYVAWSDGAGLQLGAANLEQDARLEMNFWKDAVFHPDAWRTLNVDLAPGARWTAPADEPSVMIFGALKTQVGL